MCTNPLYIKNNKRHYRPLLNKMGLEVPCGTCEECVRQRRTSYAVRATFESLKFCGTNDSPLGGTCLMVLLTYNDNSVPRVSVDKYKDEMCFNRNHVSTLLRFLSDEYHNSKDHRTFSCLIGAEYAVDERYTQRPHYHALFWVDKNISPHNFMQSIRRIWQGMVTKSVSPLGKHRVTTWDFGNLGFVLPFENDSKHSYIVKDLKAASVYCAKYAVKQVGFYNKPFMKYIIANKLKSKYLHIMPKVWTMHGFGDALLTSPTYDRVKQKVQDPYTFNEICVPTSLRDKDEYLRVWRGRYSYEYNEFGELLYNKNGTPKKHRLYDRERKLNYYNYRHKSLDELISKFIVNVEPFCNTTLAKNLAVYHYVYKHLPLNGILSLFLEQMTSTNVIDISEKLLSDRNLYHEVYDICFLQPTEDIHIFRTIHGTLRKQKAQSCDMLFGDIPILHERIYSKYINTLHDEISMNEMTFRQSQRLRTLVSPHPC